MTTTTAQHTPPSLQLPVVLLPVLAALYQLGDATAAAIAAAAGLAYSTTTPRLRKLESTGLAEPIRGDDGRTRWCLTDAGRTHATSTATPHNRRDQEAPDSTAAAPTIADIEDASPPPAAMPTVVPEAGVAAKSAERSADDSGAVVAPASVDGAPVAAPNPAPTVQVGVTATDNRRLPGSLRVTILAILQAHPGQSFKVSELCKLVDQATDTAKKASPGAVHNAAAALVKADQAVLATDKPAAFAGAALA